MKRTDVEGEEFSGRSKELPQVFPISKKQVLPGITFQILCIIFLVRPYKNKKDLHRTPGGGEGRQFLTDRTQFRFRQINLGNGNKNRR